MDGVFKKSLLGFEKTQVLTYIEQLNKENEALTADLMGKISAMEGQNEALSAENTRIRTQLNKLDEELTDSKQLQQQLSDRLVVLTGQLNEQKAKLFQAKSDNVRLGSDNDILSREIELYKEKLSVYEAKESQISEALVDAKQMAKQLVEEGRRAGESERNRILSSINGLELELGDFSRDLVTMKDEICDITQLFLDQLNQLGSTVQVYRSQLGTLSHKVQTQIDMDARTDIDCLLKKAEKKAAPQQQQKPVEPVQPVQEQKAPQANPQKVNVVQAKKSSVPVSNLMRSIQKLLNNM